MAPSWPIPEAMVGSRRTATRLPPRRNLLEHLQPFPALAVFEHEEAGGVAARARQAINVARANRVLDEREHDRHGARRLQQQRQARAATGEDDVRRERSQFSRMFASGVGIAFALANIDPYVAAVGPTQLLHSLKERREPVR